MAERVTIFDTTLRDGEQSPGATMHLEEKIEIAKALEKLNVDVIEAGFPVTSPGDFDACKIISKETKGISIAALMHANEAAIDTSWEALKAGEDPRLHIVLSASDIHLQHQLRKSREEILETAQRAVKHAARYTRNVEFSPMDASRADPEYLFGLLEAVIDAGATTVNIPDTVGYITPEEMTALISRIFQRVPNIHKAVVSVHCHNDLGMGTANTLAAIRAGARQAEVTINGIGERAGNTSLEEVVMAIHTRKDFYDLTTRIDTTNIYRASRLVSDLTGIPVQPNKAIVGLNAFRHESGLHQDGVLKNRITYEIMDAATIGQTGGTLVLGKHSGRHGFRKHLEDMGYNLSDDEFMRAFQRFKEVSDKKKEITERDIEAIIGDEMRAATETYKLEHVQVSCGDKSVPTATVSVAAPDGEILTDAATGDGPVDAVYKAINRILGVNNKLTEFSVKSVTEGIDAIGEVTIRIEANNRTYTGRGADTDIIVSSAKAYINALNKMMAAREATRLVTV